MPTAGILITMVSMILINRRITHHLFATTPGIPRFYAYTLYQLLFLITVA